MNILITTLLISFASFSAQSAPLALSIRDVLPAHVFDGGGSAVGNGGGTVVCRDPSTRIIKNAELLDFYEARVVRYFKTDISKFEGNWQQKAQAVIDRLGNMSVLRQKLYSSWLQTFLTESKYLSGVEFSKMPDSMHIGVPHGCEFEQAAIQILPKFKGDQRYYVNQDIWESLDENNKAGLVLHEMIYREALSYGHTDSISTRYFLEMVTSDDFDKLDFSEFLYLLIEAHFEKTDFKFRDSKITSQFDAIKMWRVSETLRNPPMSHFVLEGSYVANVGICKNVGCTEWETIADRPNQKICGGVDSISLPNKAYALEIFMNNNVHQCNEWLEISERDDAISFSIFSNHEQKATLNKIAYRVNSDFTTIAGQRIVFDHSEKDYKLNNFETNFSTGHNDFRIESLSINDDDSYCPVMATFEDEKIQWIRYSGNFLNKPGCDPEVTIKMASATDFHFKLVDHGKINPVQFFDGKYFSGGGLFSIETATFTPLYCDSKTPCLKVLETSSEGKVLSVSVTGGNGNIILGNQFDRAEAPLFCAVRDGIYEFYDLNSSDGLIPKRIITREKCNLLTFMTDGAEPQFIDFPAGSILEFKENGLVERKVQ